ncbi:MAG: hypothetical protein R3F31_03590 [Verrucomicrobiales bacterium]
MTDQREVVQNGMTALGHVMDQDNNQSGAKNSEENPEERAWRIRCKVAVLGLSLKGTGKKVTIARLVIQSDVVYVT